MASRTRDTALYAVTHRCGSDDHARSAAEWLPDSDGALEMFLVLRDADGLDCARLGRHELDTGQLRFDVSRQRVERAWEPLEQVR
jgi:hypothetical protein